MDPFTLALATFGVQKLRGKSTKRALRDAAIVGGGSYAIGQTALGANMGIGQGSAFSSLGFGQQAASTLPTLPKEAVAGAQFRNPGYQKALSVGAETAKKDPKGIQALLQKAKDKGVVLGRGDKKQVAAAAKDFALTIIPYLEKYKKQHGKNFSYNGYAKLLNKNDIYARNGGLWHSKQVYRVIEYTGRHDLTNEKKEAIA